MAVEKLAICVKDSKVNNIKYGQIYRLVSKDNFDHFYTVHINTKILLLLIIRHYH